MNYAESLTYWYLRLNGFFPLTDFVLHRSRRTAPLDLNLLKRSADCDLLAIRHPFVYEEIGGQSSDWDDRLRHWFPNLENELIGLIVEVKSSPEQAGNRIKAFRQPRLIYGVHRLGFVPRTRVDNIAVALKKSAKINIAEGVVAKLLVSQNSLIDDSWFNLTLSEIDLFIRMRMRKYRISKLADRMLFPDELIQYMAWSKGSDE